jgi:hypothetical protein
MSVKWVCFGVRNGEERSPTEGRTRLLILDYIGVVSNTFANHEVEIGSKAG